VCSRFSLRNRNAGQTPALMMALALLLLLTVPAAAQKDLTVKLPGAGDYLVWIEAHTSAGTKAEAPVTVSGDKAALTLPASQDGLHEWLVLALDQKSGYVAAKSLPAKDTPASLSLATTDFNRVHRVRVQVTGAGEKPVANASVTLTDSSGLALSKMIDTTSSGSAEFTDVPSGKGKVAVTAGGGKTTTKDVDVSLARGETVQAIAVPLPEVTAVVEPPAGTATTSPAAAGKPSEEKPATGPEGAGAGKTPGSTETGTTGSSAPPVAPAPTAQPSGGSGLGTLVGLILVFALLYWGYLQARNQGWTEDKVLARLGVQPVAPAPAGSIAGTPVPPSLPVDPNVCPFCGQRKDPATGTCACSLDTAPVGVAPGGSPFAGSGSGPRLVAVSGMAMGQIYPISSEATIGRDPTNSVPLSMDTTVSRRHAVIAAADGGFAIRDQGSSNGTFVNGARVTEAPLRPGDEVSIGGTRFRFEA